MIALSAFRREATLAMPAAHKGEFPKVPPEYEGRAFPYLYANAQLPGREFFGAHQKVHLDEEKVEVHDYGEHK